MKTKKNGRQGCLPTPVGKARKDDAYDEMHRGSQRNHDDRDDGNRDRTMPCKHEGDGRDRCDGKCHQAAWIGLKPRKWWMHFLMRANAMSSMLMFDCHVFSCYYWMYENVCHERKTANEGI